MKRLLAIVAALAFTQAAAAKDPVFVTSKAIADKPGVTREAGMGYVLLHSDRPTPVYLAREPTQEDQRQYNLMRAAALEKEKKKYITRLGTYLLDQKFYESVKDMKGAPPPPVAPTAPTDENFAFTPFGMLAGVSVGPLLRFAKQDGGGFLYLQAMTPGEYRIYGILTPGLAGGVCFCMGSVRFTVRASEVTNMGELNAGRLIPVEDGAAIDPRLNGWPVHAADYRAAGKLPNFYGVILNRLPEIPGILGYDRDLILDLKALAVSVKP